MVMGALVPLWWRLIQMLWRHGVEVIVTQDAVTYKIGSSVPLYACCIEDLSICQYPEPHSKHQDTPEAHYQPALEAIWYYMEILQIITQDVY